MIVVDNSVLVANFVESPYSADARAALTIDTQWLVPPLWQYEFISALCTMRLRNELDEWGARDTYAKARNQLDRRVYPADQHDVIRLAFALKISAYDAQYIALAEEFGVMCLTNDKKLSVRADRRAVLVKNYLELK